MITETAFLLQLNDERPTEPPPHLISEYIQQKRVMPAGSPRPGPIDINYTPYTIEIMDNMGPYSGISRTTVLKGVQIALTTTGENVIAYYMDPNPAEIMYCTASDALLKKWIKRLESLINSCGYRHKITAQDVSSSSARRSGDTMFSKEYPGGSLSMTSLQSPAGQRSESNQILIIDEVDGAPATHTTGEGSFLGTLEGRTAAYGAKYKILEMSTPALLETSVIYPQFLNGDQRYYNVPCVHCGGMIVLEFEYLRPVFAKHGPLESVFYECQLCNQQLFNHDKTEMMRVGNGKWIPTAAAKDNAHRSYQISAMYSPVGMLSWQRIYDFYLKAEEDPDRKPSFNNLYRGLPHKEDGSRPDVSKVIAHRGDYRKGEVPSGVLFLTMAADVQRGAVKYQDMTPDELAAEIERMKSENINLWNSGLPRIELEVYGEGLSYKSWSIDYRVFYGHTTLGPYEGAFEAIYSWADNGGMIYSRNGVQFIPKIVLMDASDGVTQAAVFAFCERFGPNTIPIINYGWLQKKKDPNTDEETSRNFDRYRIVEKSKNNSGRYIQISTNYYKKIVYERLKIPREYEPGVEQKPAFCDFPMDLADHYFHMLTNEELLTDGSFKNGGRPVEALDIRAYNLCAANVWLEGMVRKAREGLERKGYNKASLERLDKKWYLKEIAAMIEAEEGRVGGK